ncbi:MAG: response regulator [Candidatus Binatia bacterium]|nr:MAG: response regulator [Candidatus Binatia bacterium]
MADEYPSKTLRPARILLVEDNPDDVDLVRRALQRGHVDNPITVIGDGRQAFELLVREANRLDRPPFDLLLLDLTLPGLDGRVLLQEIQADKRLRRMPALVLTGSAREEDWISAYKSGAVAFLRKPFDLERFLATIGDLYGYRIVIVKEDVS